MKLVLLFSITLIAAVAIAQTNNLELREPPTFAPVKEHKPLAKPAEYQRVAILNIKLNYEKGEVVGASLVRSRTIASVAPKVFARQMGDWQVIIGDNEKMSFFVNDPGFLEAENDDKDKVPYHYVSRGTEVVWDLVVPLYKDGQKLDASMITIERVKDGKLILQTEI